MTVDFDLFDNDDPETTDGQYSVYVEMLSDIYSTRFRDCAGDPSGQEEVLRDYIRRGEKANLTLPELIDFLGVSSNNVLERAGYSETEGDAVFAILATLSETAGSDTVSV